MPQIWGRRGVARVWALAVYVAVIALNFPKVLECGTKVIGVLRWAM